jgi:hypothetical protein
MCNTMPYFLSSVAHVWVPGAKSTGPIAKKFGFQLSLNNPLVLIGFYHNLYQHALNTKLSISHCVFNEKSAGRRHRQCFLLDKPCRKMYTIVSHDVTSTEEK